MTDGWIVIPGWDKFQHYTDRRPVWIKLYLELADNDDWGRLSYAQRGLLVSLWIEFGASRGILSVDSVAQRCRQKTRRAHLESLADAGFIDIVASKPLALARARDLEVREEKKKTRARTRENPDNPQNVEPADPGEAIATMIRNGVITDPVDLDAEIDGYHLNGELVIRLHNMLRPIP